MSITGQGNFTVDRTCPRDSGGKRTNSYDSRGKSSDRRDDCGKTTPERISRESGAAEPFVEQKRSENTYKSFRGYPWSTSSYWSFGQYTPRLLYQWSKLKRLHPPPILPRPFSSGVNSYLKCTSRFFWKSNAAPTIFPNYESLSFLPGRSELPEIEWKRDRIKKRSSNMKFFKSFALLAAAVAQNSWTVSWKLLKIFF